MPVAYFLYIFSPEFRYGQIPFSAEGTDRSGADRALEEIAKRRQRLERFIGEKDKSGSAKAQAVFDFARIKELGASVSLHGQREAVFRPNGPIKPTLVELTAKLEAVHERVLERRKIGRNRAA